MTDLLRRSLYCTWCMMPQLWNRYHILVPVHWILVSSISIVCYVNSCWGGFVFDDNEAVISNGDVTSNSPLADVFANDFWGTKISHNNSHKSYRPLTILTFRWNYWFSGDLNPFIFHLTNVIVHPIVCILYYEVCRCLCKESQRPDKRRNYEWVSSPLIAALTFAVHPVHTESIAGIVGRAELMSAVCYFSAFFCYIKSTSLESSLSVISVVITVVLAGCAMLFKEQGVTVLGLCLAYDVLFNMRLNSQIQMIPSWKTFATRVLLMTVCTVIMLATRMITGSPKFKPVDNPASFADSWITRVLSYNYIYALNCWLLLNPSWLCFDWSMGCIPLLDSAKDCRLMAVITFWLAFGSLLLYGFLGRAEYYKRLVMISLAMLIIPFLPATNLFIHVGFVIAERVLYLPSSGWCLLFALGSSIMIKHHKTACAPLFIILILMFSSRSIQRSQQWQTEESLFVSGLAVCPRNAKVLYNIGKIKSDAGQMLIAEAAYREAITLYPEYDQALNNLGNLLKESGRIIEAEEKLQRAITVNHEFAAAWMNLGIIKATLNKTEEAESCYQTAIKHRRKYPDAYYNLGNLYIDSGRLSDAAAAFRSAIKLQGNHINAWNNLGLLYENQGMYDEAESVIQEAIKQMPNNSHFYYSLGVLMGRMQKYKEGKELLNKAISMDPTSANYHANLGVIYHLMKQYKEAEQLYSHALQLNPDLAVAKDNLIKLLKSRTTADK